MDAMAMATDEQLLTLDAVVSSLGMIEKTLNSVMAARDGMLAIASRLALSMAEEGDGVDASDLTVRAVAAELGAALRVSDRTVQRRMADAEFTVDRFPVVWAAQGAGRIGSGHARVIVDAGAHLEDAAAREAYSMRVLEVAEVESPNRLKPIAARLTEQFQARSLAERHEDAREKRAVWVKDAPDGMAELGLLGPAVLVHGVFDRLTSMAKTLTSATPDPGVAPAHEMAPALGMVPEPVEGPAAPGPVPERVEGPAPDSRTLSQLRADLALDLLLAGTPAGHDTPDGLLATITAHVSVTVPVFTLMNTDNPAIPDSPAAELDGRSPIDPATARAVAGAATGWDRVLTHPITGALLAVDRYRPGEALRRHLRARDQRCRFLCCGMPARHSDLDHTHDAAHGGPTTDTNLGALCRRHHILKHHSPWHVRQTRNGRLEWTSPTGRTYTDQPPPQNTVTFTPVEDTSMKGPSGNGEPAGPWATPPPELLTPF